MSVLETFYILFKSDASDVKKGTKEAKDSTDQLNGSLKNTGDAGDKIGESFAQVARSFTGMISAAYVFGEIIRGIKEATNYAINVNLQSQLLGVNAQELLAWGSAVKQVGGTAESFNQSLKSLSENTGLNPNNAIRLLPLLADSFKQLGRFQSFRTGKMLGLDENTILLLMRGRQEIQALIKTQKELFPFTERENDAFKKLGIALSNVNTGFHSVFVTAAYSIIPTLQKMAESFLNVEKVFIQHPNLIIGALLGISAAALRAAFSFGLLSIEALAIIILIGLFAILYDDVKTFFNDGDSLTGRFLKRWPMIDEAIKGTIGWLKDLIAAIDLLDFGKGKILKIDNRAQSDLTIGQRVLAESSSLPINTASPAGFLNRGGNSRNVSVNTGDINVFTQATDAEGIGDVVAKTLKDHIWQSNSNFDDGVQY